MTSIFDVALEQLAQREKSGFGWTEPEVFQEYLARTGGPAIKTADAISVQSFERLDSALREKQAMVFRLGSGGAGKTRFPLARAHCSVRDEYFLIDDSIFPGSDDTFIPDVSVPDLFPFTLLKDFEETGSVNFAIASGLLAHALQLREPAPRVAPARGAGSYTFDVRPSAGMAAVWPHRSGQVEIDATFLARDDSGRWKLFVVEAKHGQRSASLPKYKLVYPAYAIARMDIPRDIEIVPVYLRSWAEAGRVVFCVARCELKDPASSTVTDLRVVAASRFSVRWSSLG